MRPHRCARSARSSECPSGVARDVSRGWRDASTGRVGGPDVITEDDCEALALGVIRETGLDDRPHADPRIIAVAWAGLELRPEPFARPHIADGVIVVPAGISDVAEAYFVGHELGHEILRWSGYRLGREDEERAASRVASALLLPARSFRRDLRAGCDIAQLRQLWPLASPWTIARRIVELHPSRSVAMFAASGRRLRSAGPAMPTFGEGRSVDGVIIAVVDGEVTETACPEGAQHGARLRPASEATGTSG